MLTKKSMLSRSFKATKCKTSLKLAVSRIKLLKNRREIQVKQIRKEVAQLLATGQEQTARIRVEHVVREEKTMLAYDLIEIYCELIAARLPIIESQKNCPIDLKEAISSVIFASPRCADIPELMDVRKHFVAKYGKEFVTSAIEVRPESGVNRMIVEKLSAIAPDIQTKAKILSAIAKEHDIQWDSKGLVEEVQKSEDLLNGPSNFSSANKIPMESLNSSSFPNARTLNPQTSSSQNEPRVSENKAGSSDIMDSYPSEDIHMNKIKWRMEFKDAASAAQVAAESAEKASIAARAAAELASQGNISMQNSNESRGNISKPYSNEPSGSSIGSSLDEKPNRLWSSKLKSSESVNVEFGQVEGMLPKDELRDNKSSDGNMEFSFYKGKMETFDNSMKTFSGAESLAEKQSYNEAGSVKENVKVNYDRSASASSTVSVGDDSIWVQTPDSQHGNHGNLEYGCSEIASEERCFGYDNEQISFDHPAPVFDEYDPEVNDAKGNLSDSFWKERDDLASEFASSNTSATSKIFSNSHLESRPSTVEKVASSKFDDTLRVNFDDSDGYSSELEDDSNKHQRTTLKNTNLQNSVTDLYEMMPKSTLKSQSLLWTEEKAQHEVLESSSLIGTKDTETSGNLAIVDKGEEEVGLNFGRLTGGIRNRGYLNPPYVKSSEVDSSVSAKGSVGKTNLHGILRYEQESSWNADQSDSTQGALNRPESGKAKEAVSEVYMQGSISINNFAFDKLEQENEDFEEKQFVSHQKGSRKYTELDLNPTKLDSSVISTKHDVDFRENQVVSHKKSSRKDVGGDPNPPELVPYDSSISTTSDVSHLDKTQASVENTSKQAYNQKLLTKAYNVMSYPASRAHFDSNGDGKEEESQNNMGSRGNAGNNTNIKLSRRTRDFPPMARSNLPKHGGYSDIPNSMVDSVSHGVDKETTTQNNQNSIPLKPNSVAEHPVNPRENKKSPGRNLDSYTAPVNTGNDNPSDFGGSTIQHETSIKKASHVHPKLPDYDSLAAHFQSLRSNRR